MSLRRGVFPLDMLRLIAPTPPPDVPPLGVGDRCMLNSGGPVMTVVDFADDEVVVSWDGEGGMESTFLRACVRRLRERSGR
jgi:uncharacterized protein YodC (DUF2158 family)